MFDVDFSGREQGAGLGLSMMFEASQKMIVSVVPGRLTDVTCLVNLKIPRRRARSWIKSLHVLRREP